MTGLRVAGQGARCPLGVRCASRWDRNRCCPSVRYSGRFLILFSESKQREDVHVVAYSLCTKAQGPRAASSRSANLYSGLPGTHGTWPEMACLGTRLCTRLWEARPSVAKTRSSWLWQAKQIGFACCLREAAGCRDAELARAESHGPDKYRRVRCVWHGRSSPRCWRETAPQVSE